MASDEIVWHIINQQFCSFKLKTPGKGNFCREPHNVSGLCNRTSCPLANSRYATVRSDPAKGTLYLYIKTIERCHLPSKMWERIKLSANYAKALEQIDEKLMYFPKYLNHKCKQRLTRLTQVAIRTRKLEAESLRLGEKLVPKMAPKIKKREQARERKAEAAAKIEKAVERELLLRLRQGAYGDQPLNVSEAIWKKVLNAMEKEGAAARDQDMDKGIEDEEEGEAESEEEELESEREEDADMETAVEYVSDFDESDNEELQDIEDWLESDEDDEEDDDEEDSASDNEGDKKRKKGKSKDAPRKKGRVVRMNGKKRVKEMEVERVGNRERLLAF